MKLIYFLITFLFSFASGLKTWSQEISFLTDSTITYSFSSATDSVLSNKTVLAYDVNGNQTLQENYSWNSTLNEWVEYVKLVFAYDDNGNEILSEGYIWYPFLNEWMGYLKIVYSYDADGNQTLQEKYSWNSTLNEWIVTTKIVYSFDVDGNKTLQENFSWNSTLNEWIVTTKIEFSFDADGNKTLQEVSDWDSNLNEWIEFSNVEYLHDANGNGTGYIKYSWDSNLSVWVLESRGIYFKSIHSYLFSENLTICEGDSILWQGIYHDTIGTYTASFVTNSLIDSAYVLYLNVNPKPLSFNITGQNIVDEYQNVQYSAPANSDVSYNWLAVNGNIISNPSEYIAEIHWGDIGEGSVYAVSMYANGCSSDTAELQVTIGTNSFEDIYNQSDINIYPIPAREMLYIEGLQKKSMGRIYSANGQIVFSAEIDVENGEINVSKLPYGLYILKVMIDDGELVKRFTKK